MLQLILASASPHRANMLKELGYDFQIYKTAIEEIWQPDLTPTEAVKDLAKRKAAAAAALFPQALVLAADTIVINEQSQVLLKPKSAQEALSFLHARSASCERVITGFCLTIDKQTYLDSEISDIRYEKIPAALQEEIIHSDEWRDVCGGLKIEGLIAPYIAEIRGSRTNIMGLPTERLAPLLNRIRQAGSLDLAL